MTIWRKRIASWIIKATNTHSEYVVRVAFPPQQLLHERASMLRYAYVHCPSCNLVTLNKFRRRGSTFTTKINAFFSRQPMHV
jgi:phage FluMu protein Com